MSVGDIDWKTEFDKSQEDLLLLKLAVKSLLEDIRMRAEMRGDKDRDGTVVMDVSCGILDRVDELIMDR